MNAVTAGQVATELRKIADALDKEPEAVIVPAMLSFFCTSYSVPPDTRKEAFLNLVRLLPKPLEKSGGASEYVVQNKSDATVWILCRAARNEICKLVTPAREAVYDCEPLLSADEEATLV